MESKIVEQEIEKVNKLFKLAKFLWQNGYDVKLVLDNLGDIKAYWLEIRLAKNNKELIVQILSDEDKLYNVSLLCYFENKKLVDEEIVQEYCKNEQEVLKVIEDVGKKYGILN